MRAWAAPPTLHIAGLRAKKRVYVRNSGFALAIAGSHTSVHTATDTESVNVQFHSVKPVGCGLFSPNGSALWWPHHRKPRPRRRQSGGIAPSKAATRRQHAPAALRMAQNPHRHRRGERRGHGEPDRSVREQRQGAAIARLLARGLRQSTTQLAQQEPHLAASGQNSPCSPLLAACAVQNSPRSPKMAQFGVFCPHRESFVPLCSTKHRAGRGLYRTRGRVAASHDSTPGPTSAEGAGGSGGSEGSGGRGGSGGHGRASSRRNPPRCRWTVARPQPDKFRMQFDWTKFQQTQKTLQFQRCKFNI